VPVVVLSVSTLAANPVMAVVVSYVCEMVSVLMALVAVMSMVYTLELRMPAELVNHLHTNQTLSDCTH
jgi:hypothetical protein